MTNRTTRAKPRLVIVCGLPGAGKTTLARRLDQDLAAVRFCPDEWLESLGCDLWDGTARVRVEALQWQQARRLLSLGSSVIIEWGTWARCERDELRRQARELGAGVELRYLTAVPEVLFERLQRRGAEQPPITLEELKTWYDGFELPTPAELALYDATL